jgi:hypothetical protein
MLNLRNFGDQSFDRNIFDNSCHFREELSQVYNILIPVREMSELISYFYY